MKELNKAILTENDSIDVLSRENGGKTTESKALKKQIAGLTDRLRSNGRWSH